jgi:subfamily B ATP-binding cassette protein MsbA
MRPFAGMLLLASFFNLLTVIFSIGSVGALIPILNLIFDTPGTDLTGAAQWKVSLAEAIQALKESRGALYTLQTVVIITLGIFVAKNLSRYAALWILAPVRNGVVANYKQALHDKWLAMNFRQHQKLQKGDQLTRATADLTEIEWTMLKGMEGLVRDPLMILGTLILLFSMSPRLTLMAIAIIPISGGLIATIGKSLKESAQAAQSQLGNTTSELEEALTNFPIIQSYVAENRRATRFGQSVDLWRKFMINVYRKRDLSSPIAEVLGVGVLLAVLYLGGQEVLNGRSLTGGELVAFVVLFYQLIPAFKNLTNALYDIQKGNASAARIFEVLDEEEAKDGDLEVKSSHWEQGLRFENASFAYEPGVPVIKGLHLDLLPGKTTALVGPSGGGKSTLLHLLAGFDYPQNGALNLAEVPLNSFKRATYRKHTGWVPQQPLLFNDTIAANVSMSGRLDKSRLMHALEAAHCLEFAEEYLANETLIGEGGNQLSGGQRQRLSIARAFYADPSLLLLDEATAALDNESEARVQEALIALMKGRTTVVVAHRLSTVQHADQIAYVEEGQVVELGTHSELLQKAGKYSALVNLGTLNAEA